MDDVKRVFMENDDQEEDDVPSCYHAWEMAIAAVSDSFPHVDSDCMKKGVEDVKGNFEDLMWLIDLTGVDLTQTLPGYIGTA